VNVTSKLCFVDFGGNDSNNGNTSNETNRIMMPKMSLCWIISSGIRTIGSPETQIMPD